MTLSGSTTTHPSDIKPVNGVLEYPVSRLNIVHYTRFLIPGPSKMTETTTSITETMTPRPLTITLENGNVINLSTADVGEYNEDDFDTIPILDLTDLYHPDVSKRAALAKELKNFASTIGFFYIKNHHIPKEIVDGAFETSKKFFELSQEEKMSIWTGLFPAGQYTGYHPMSGYNRHGNKFNDLYEAFNMSYDPEFDPIPPPQEKAVNCYSNRWPESLPEMKEVMMKYQGECLKLGRKMMSLVALGFGLSEEYFDDAVQAPSGGLRIIHYPVQTNSASDQNGIGPHTDFQVLTFVNPGEVSGLQVINKRGQWIEVPPLPDHLIVNVADCLQRVSNDELVSTVHRVVNNKEGKERYSMPYFLGFDNEYMLNPLPGVITEDKPEKYADVVSSKEYCAWRSKMAKSGKTEKLTVKA